MTEKRRDCCVGRYLIIEEPNGEGTVSKDGDPKYLKEFSTFEAALEWATGEAELEEAEKADVVR